jgi:hypothetical protein
VKGQNRLFHYPLEACGKRSASMFSRSGWSVVRSVSLAKGGTSKKRPSPHIHKFPTQSNKTSPRTSRTAHENVTIWGTLNSGAFRVIHVLMTDCVYDEFWKVR